MSKRHLLHQFNTSYDKQVTTKRTIAKQEPTEGARKSSREKKEIERFEVSKPEVKKRKRSYSSSPDPKKTTKKATKKSKKEGPKRAKSGFILFSLAYRKEIVKKNPDATFGAIGKLLGKAWANANPAERKVCVILF